MHTGAQPSFLLPPVSHQLFPPCSTNPLRGFGEFLKAEQLLAEKYAMRPSRFQPGVSGEHPQVAGFAPSAMAVLAGAN